MKPRIRRKEITIEGIFHRMWLWSSYFINLGVKLVISTFLGMGSKDIVYKLNEPLGLGYALWASYALTALLFVLLPNPLNVEKQPLNLQVRLRKSHK